MFNFFWCWLLFRQKPCHVYDSEVLTISEMSNLIPTRLLQDRISCIYSHIGKNWNECEDARPLNENGLKLSHSVLTVDAVAVLFMSVWAKIFTYDAIVSSHARSHWEDLTWSQRRRSCQIFPMRIYTIYVYVIRPWIHYNGHYFVLERRKKYGRYVQEWQTFARSLKTFSSEEISLICK